MTVVIKATNPVVSYKKDGRAETHPFFEIKDTASGTDAVRSAAAIKKRNNSGLPVNRAIDLVKTSGKPDKPQQQHDDRILVFEILVSLITQPATYANGDQQLQGKATIPEIVVIGI